jgi:hypothetical protein
MNNKTTKKAISPIVQHDRAYGFKKGQLPPMFGDEAAKAHYFIL